MDGNNIPAMEKAVSMIFSLNTRSGNTMTFSEFNTLALVQPQIFGFLRLLELPDDDKYIVNGNALIDIGMKLKGNPRRKRKKA